MWTLIVTTDVGMIYRMLFAFNPIMFLLAPSDFIRNALLFFNSRSYVGPFNSPPERSFQVDDRLFMHHRSVSCYYILRCFQIESWGADHASSISEVLLRMLR